jgi:hypothetical protein
MIASKLAIPCAPRSKEVPHAKGRVNEDLDGSDPARSSAILAVRPGFWLEEFAAPYDTFKEAGAEIVLASPKGGDPPLDPKSNEPNLQHRASRRNPYPALFFPTVLSRRPARHGREPIDAGPSAFINH